MSLLLKWLVFVCVVCCGTGTPTPHGSSNDIQSVVQHLYQRVDEQQTTLNLLLKLVKQQDATIKSLNAELVHVAKDVKEKQVKQENDLAAVRDRLSKDEHRVEDNGVAVKRIEGNLVKQNDDIENVKTEVSDQKVGLRQNKVEIKNINEQMKYLVLEEMTLSIYNKVNTTSRLQQHDDQRITTTTTTDSVSDDSQWVLKMDPSGCFRIFNSKYGTYRITLWRAVSLGMYAGEYYPDQLWRFQYDSNGYYSIVNCYYPEYTIQLHADGTPVAKKKNYKDNELWKLVPVRSIERNMDI